jgi:hypothetical protein
MKKMTMKKFILSIAIATILASCSNKPSHETTTTKTVSTTDTIGLSDYKEWKQKQEVVSQQTYTSPGVEEMPATAQPAPAPEVVKPKTVIVYRDAPVKQQHVAKASKPASRPIYKAPEESKSAEVITAPNPVSTGTKREPYGRGTGTTGTEGTAGSGTTTSGEGTGGVVTGSSTPAEIPSKQGGWSKAAKDGAIGGASGAVIGAVISKNKGAGAVIGGIVGAAGGYIFGKNQDKKVEKQQ